MNQERERGQELYGKIEQVLVKRGMKGCTMDVVAATLGMSKRTLYEIFGSKDEMIRRVLADMDTRHRADCEKIFRETPNVMEAMARYAFYTQRAMQRLSPEFLQQLQISPELRRHKREEADKNTDRLMALVRRALDQGVFRQDVDYPVSLRLLSLQYESLACMSDIFPPQVTLPQAFQAITIGFLRSIASPEGMRILDKIINDQFKQTK